MQLIWLPAQVAEEGIHQVCLPCKIQCISLSHCAVKSWDRGTDCVIWKPMQRFHVHTVFKQVAHVGTSHSFGGRCAKECRGDVFLTPKHAQMVRLMM